MHPLRPNQQRADQAIFIAWILLIALICSLFSDWLEYIYLGKEEMDDEANTANDVRQVIIGMFSFVTNIVFIIFFIRWFRRAYFNLHEINHDRLRYAEGYAAGSWFVPFMNLVVPFRIMKDIWRETQQYIDDENYNPGEALLGWWWALFLISYFANNLASRLSLRADTVEQLRNASIASICADTLAIPSLLITIYMIKKVSAFETHLATSIIKAHPEEEGTAWENKLS